ncbi:MAG: cytochrome c/FTR1 family iron permease [Burkholderiaceae bacterium]|nr:cytochrome c/FTR1 family iron permease [Burkholderiaceae bacterium]
MSILGWLVCVSAFAQPAAPTPIDARQLWQLIDYVAVDYGGAVANGAVVSEFEYAEMLDFTNNAVKQVQALPSRPTRATISAAIADLRAAVVGKADSAEVTRLAHRANALLLAAYPMPVAPRTLPDLAKGAAVYTALCASCHGAKGAGDGPLAANLEPKPIAFTDAERAGSRSLMALYQVVSQGVEGTSMTSYLTLSEEDRWAVAFYIGTMSSDTATRQRGAQLWQKDASLKDRFPDLTAVSTVTEQAAAQTMQRDTARDVIAYLRSHPAAVEAGKPIGLALARLRLKESLDAMRAGDRAQATKLGLSAYLDGFEPIEPIVGARNQALLTSVEDGMLAYRSAVATGTPSQAEEAAAHLGDLFAQVDTEIGNSKADPTTTFIGAFTILLREGLEALLIVIGMIAALKKAGRPDVLRHVHAGWISALGAGVLTWVIATYLVTISGASREVTEGVGAVFASVVLLTVGMWMHQKSSAGRWQSYLEEKLSAAMTRRSMWALFALAFIAVYREVFETVLFYSALAADGNGSALMAGFATAVILLGGIAWVMLRTTARMPIGKFFSITSVFVAVLAVILIGKGAAALQEAGWVGATPVWAPRVDLLGVFPTVETVVAQLTVLAIALSGFGLNLFSARKNNTGQPTS